MVRKWLQRMIASLTNNDPARRTQPSISYRHSRIESLEDRRMLSAEADIVFLIDKTKSSGEEYGWIGDIVSGPTGLDAYLTDPSRDIDPRYGLIGFGDSGTSANTHGHAHLLDSSDTFPVGGDGDQFFGTAAQLDAIADNTVIIKDAGGSFELAWDGIEFGISEYEFRESAAVIFVLFRRDDNGGIPRIFAGNEPEAGGKLTHEGILAAMQSYNVTLNSVVEATFDPAMSGANGIVLGVEADEADGVINGEHIAHVVNGIANQPNRPDFLQASHEGSNSGTFVDTGKSIIISPNATAEIAGPSVADYRAESSTAVFDDISGTGTLITDFTIPFGTPVYKELSSTDLGNFSFDFFGTSYSDLYVNGDGTITFGEASDTQADFPDPILDWQENPPSMPQIAALGGQFAYFEESVNTYWQVKDAGSSNERLIVQWDNYNFSFDSGTGAAESVTFQAVLQSNGDILFSYDDLDVTDSLYTEGKLATVGIATGSFLYPETIPAGVFVDGVHNIPGTNNANGQKFTGVENDFVRLAWETGGAAWNNDIISGQSDAFLADFDTAFIESIATQIADKHASGDVVFADDPLLEINLGGGAVGNYIADTGFITAGATAVSTTQTILQNGNSMAGDADTLSVFQTARSTSGNGNDLVLNLPASEVPDGSYVVELMFADLDLSGVTPFMDVTFENALNPVLVDYDVSKDFANVRVLSATPQAPEYEFVTTALAEFNPIVKRYAVEVTDGNGLQITLSVKSNREALLNGLRILKTPSTDLPPTISDVKLDRRNGSTPITDWVQSAEVSFKTQVEAGKQFQSIVLAGANTIEIDFNQPVVFGKNGDVDGAGNANGNELELKGFNNAIVVHDAFVLSSDGKVATWTFNNPLPDDKYAIHLDTTGIRDLVTDDMLDADWANANADSGTPDNYLDDLPNAFELGDQMPGTLDNNFRLHFAYLPGDFDGDHDVDGSDFNFWNVNNTDADGDGDADADDLLVWQDHQGQLPLLGVYAGDYHSSDNEIIDLQDLIQWWNDSGTTNGGGDFLVWQPYLGDFSAWYEGTPNVGNAGSVPLILLGPAPQVTNVTISGSASMHSPYAFDTVDGSGDQLLTVPVGGADTISITFNELVNISADSLDLIGLYSANVPTLAEFSYDPVTLTASWRFEAWALGDEYLISLHDSVTDVEGNLLDGEWVNPQSRTTVNSLVSEFPSGDGVAGGHFNFVATLLPGDANLDGMVDNADVAILMSNTSIVVDALFAQGDFNGDGDVDIFQFNGGGDSQILSANWGTVLGDVWILADLNGDMVVDALDKQTIFDNYGMSNPTHSDGDLNGDGVVDVADFDLAFDQMGLGLAVVA